MAAATTQNPRYEEHKNPPLFASLGHGLQFSLIASAVQLGYQLVPLVGDQSLALRPSPTAAVAGAD